MKYVNPNNANIVFSRVTLHHLAQGLSPENNEQAGWLKPLNEHYRNFMAGAMVEGSVAFEDYDAVLGDAWAMQEQASEDLAQAISKNDTAEMHRQIDWIKAVQHIKDELAQVPYAPESIAQSLVNVPIEEEAKNRQKAIANLIDNYFLELQVILSTYEEQCTERTYEGFTAWLYERRC